MKQKLLVTLLCAGLSPFALAAGPAPATPAPAAPAAAAVAPAAIKPLATINGVAIPPIYGAFIKQSRSARGVAPENLTDESIRDSVINMELLAQEARRKGLDKGPSLQAAIEFQTKEIMGQAALEDFARSNPVSEELVRAEYEKAKAKAGTTEYRPRHILVPSEKEARALIAKLNTGKKAKFEDLAKASSKDSSAGNGGDLGWILPANLVPEFATAMAKLKKGEVTQEPVQTPFGWHVIKLEDSRKLDFPEFDKLKGRIAGQLQQLQLRKYVQELRATARVE
jgi:peptidyl-prolyl cis-trans isomerase C